MTLALGLPDYRNRADFSEPRTIECVVRLFVKAFDNIAVAQIDRLIFTYFNPLLIAG